MPSGKQWTLINVLRMALLQLLDPLVEILSLVELEVDRLAKWDLQVGLGPVLDNQVEWELKQLR